MLKFNLIHLWEKQVGVLFSSHNQYFFFANAIFPMFSPASQLCLFPVGWCYNGSAKSAPHGNNKIVFVQEKKKTAYYLFYLYFVALWRNCLFSLNVID